LGLLLFPIYFIPNVYSYTKHSLRSTLEASKNTFYRFKNNSKVNWRNIIQKYNRALFIRLNKESKQVSDNVRCLIIDDTYFEKSTYKTEHVGKIWSHVKQPNMAKWHLLASTNTKLGILKAYETTIINFIIKHTQLVPNSLRKE